MCPLNPGQNLSWVVGGGGGGSSCQFGGWRRKAEAKVGDLKVDRGVL